jgi:hypothetical protein
MEEEASRRRVLTAFVHSLLTAVGAHPAPLRPASPPARVDGC